ncbi:MAG: ATP-dependent DNA helicase RecQ [Gemmatimonadaceae bacterium]
MSQPSIAAACGVLKSAFGYAGFRPGQEAAIESVLAGRDTLVVLPTGGGKSLCFQVPALVLPGLTVVVSPLISLMKDQVDALDARGLPAAFINSSLNSSQVSDRLGRATRGELKLLYLAPERFDYGNIAERLRKMGISLLAVDEAHCISQWGHDFRPSYLRVKDVRAKLGAPPTIALTATATPSVRDDIVLQLRLRDPKIVITGFNRTNLTYHVLPARNDAEKDAQLVQTLRSHDGLGVVYASTRKSVDRLSTMLERQGIPAAAYHAGLEDRQRRDVQESFMAERLRVIVATNAFGMGIDKPNVRLVVHHSMPGTLEAYYQEAGRAGRDGKHSDVFLIHSFPDRFTHEFFIRGSYPERTTIEAVYTTLVRQSQRGELPQSPSVLASLVGGKTSEREAESALRILNTAGAIVDEAASTALARVRLLATPERIKRELTGDADPALGILRALWRIAGEKLQTGATVNLDSLPPGLAGLQTASSLLDDLQSRQLLIWERVGGGLRLVSPDMPIQRLNVDWSLLARRRTAELNKLDAVQKYVYAKGCRRGFVLRYFGDPAAMSKCDGCDNCLGIAVARPPAGGPSPRKVRERKRSRDPGTAGQPARAKQGEKASRASEDISLDAAEQKLFEALRATRSEIARKEKLPAYIVFWDRTLAEIAKRRPRSLAALREVPGVGAAKLERYGNEFLAVINRSEGTEAA